jgi:hypothetical protein
LLRDRVDAGLVRIDPHTNRVSATTPLASLDSDPYHARLAVSAGRVWVGGRQRQQDGLAHAVIDRVDPASRLRATIATGALSPAALMAGLGPVAAAAGRRRAAAPGSRRHVSCGSHRQLARRCDLAAGTANR